MVRTRCLIASACVSVCWTVSPVRRAKTVVHADGTITYQSDEADELDEDGRGLLDLVMGDNETRTDEVKELGHGVAEVKTNMDRMCVESSDATEIRELKKDYQCGPTDELEYMSDADCAASCADFVKNAGGKYFLWGHGGLTMGFCYKQYTRSETCPQGFQKAKGYTSYVIDTWGDHKWKNCYIDMVKLTLSDKNVNLLQGTAILQKKHYAEDDPHTLFSVTRTTSSQTCRVQYRIGCEFGFAQINEWESCCNGNDCTPPDNFEKTDRTKVRLDDSWQYEVADDEFDFTLNASTMLPLPTPLYRYPRIKVEVNSKTTPVLSVYATCPLGVKTIVGALLSIINGAYTSSFSSLIPTWGPLGHVMDKSAESSVMAPDVFGDYTRSMTAILLHSVLRKYTGANTTAEQRIALPTTYGPGTRLSAYNFAGGLLEDMDTNVRQLSDYDGCILGALRDLEWEDDVAGDSTHNTWEYLWTKVEETKGCPGDKTHCSKKEYVKGVFQGYTTEDGHPVYPKESIDFQGLFYVDAETQWVDHTEYLIAWGSLGMHRLRKMDDALVSPSGGETGVYVIKTAALSTLETRAGFGVPGVDMYFTESGLPIMIDHPKKGKLWRTDLSNEDWQYWKFVWRSSYFLYVTAFDHLYGCHFRSASLLAGVSREALPPKHPLRRLLTIFSQGSIKTNAEAMSQLVGGRHLLDRSTPFKNFMEVSEAAKSLTPTMQELFGPLMGETDKQRDDNIMKTPYYQDGTLMFNIFGELVSRWVDLYSPEWCVDGNLATTGEGGYIYHMMQENVPDFAISSEAYMQEEHTWLGLYTEDGKVTCSGLKKWLSVYAFHVTVFHRHVGTVADYAGDPDFAAFSWKDGVGSMPRQHWQLALIAGSTSMLKPKIDEDYSFVATGIAHETEAKSILLEFQKALMQATSTIDARNDERTYTARGGDTVAIPYVNMMPIEVECSVAI